MFHSGTLCTNMEMSEIPDQPPPSLITDLESGSIKNDLAAGYPRLAQEMSNFPETTIIRSFSCLATRILLYMQAELTGLHTRLLTVEDCISKNEDRPLYAVDWASALSVRMDQSTDGSFEAEHSGLVTKIRHVMKEYYKFVILTNSVYSLKEPSQYDLAHIQSLLSSDMMGPCAMVGDDFNTWGSIEQPTAASPDLFAMTSRETMDPFSEFFVVRFVRTLLRFNGFGMFKPSTFGGSKAYRIKTISHIARAITTMIMAFFTSSAIISLYFVQRKDLKVAMAVVYIFLGATSLNFLGLPTHIEIFIFIAT
ncbi:hypothetical protein EJ05DRAFT_509594 [Pseudovirgaria hyperparasitica]|uniref:DUF6594 domain-containing protein n=1 Tax=Pseudovirgaria hyperparasitica TaxID=470096 RepID=A0A6A6WBH0_9PEZI|nr:uncharacterized protein EJ05DRAFT_509594 [Pseudovirgaria hyperparasitica]KAF2759915.1 hypothetical protein EJ05DRAFT_509594 [Pseudovirgaria hyperparasitica]